MNILLLGKNGQVGRELTRSLLPLGQLTALGQSDLDLKDPVALKLYLENLKPDLIVNAAAYTAVDKAEKEQNIAFSVNATAVDILANYAKKHDSLLVHYSTDYVFDGTKQTPYQETDTTNPLSIYGASKLQGEQVIRTSQCRHLIFRTSWVYSAFGHNFIKTILNLARHKQTLSIVNDQHGTPTSAELIADLTVHAIIAHLHNRLSSGLYHLTASGKTTWYQLACYAVNKIIPHDIDLALEPSKITPILTQEYPLPAARPKNSVLDTTHLSSQLNVTLPDWSVYVDRTIEQLLQIRFFS